MAGSVGSMDNDGPPKRDAEAEEEYMKWVLSLPAKKQLRLELSTLGGSGLGFFDIKRQMMQARLKGTWTWDPTTGSGGAGDGKAGEEDGEDVTQGRARILQLKRVMKDMKAAQAQADKIRNDPNRCKWRGFVRHGKRAICMNKRVVNGWGIQHPFCGYHATRCMKAPKPHNTFAPGCLPIQRDFINQYGLCLIHYKAMNNLRDPPYIPPFKVPGVISRGKLQRQLDRLVERAREPVSHPLSPWVPPHKERVAGAAGASALGAVVAGEESDKILVLGSKIARWLARKTHPLKHWRKKKPAALTIQRVYRGHRDRRRARRRHVSSNYEERSEAIVTIQKVTRGMFDRRRVADRRTRWTRATRVIQKAFRGYRMRQLMVEIVRRNVAARVVRRFGRRVLWVILKRSLQLRAKLSIEREKKKERIARHLELVQARKRLDAAARVINKHWRAREARLLVSQMKQVYAWAVRSISWWYWGAVDRRKQLGRLNRCRDAANVMIHAVRAFLARRLINRRRHEMIAATQTLQRWQRGNFGRKRARERAAWYEGNWKWFNPGLWTQIPRELFSHLLPSEYYDEGKAVIGTLTSQPKDDVYKATAFGLSEHNARMVQYLMAGVEYGKWREDVLRDRSNASNKAATALRERVNRIRAKELGRLALERKKQKEEEDRRSAEWRAKVMKPPTPTRESGDMGATEAGSDGGSPTTEVSQVRPRVSVPRKMRRARSAPRLRATYTATSRAARALTPVPERDSPEVSSSSRRPKRVRRRPASAAPVARRPAKDPIIRSGVVKSTTRRARPASAVEVRDGSEVSARTRGNFGPATTTATASIARRALTRSLSAHARATPGQHTAASSVGTARVARQDSGRADAPEASTRQKRSQSARPRNSRTARVVQRVSRRRPATAVSTSDRRRRRGSRAGSAHAKESGAGRPVTGVRRVPTEVMSALVSKRQKQQEEVLRQRRLNALEARQAIEAGRTVVVGSLNSQRGIVSTILDDGPPRKRETSALTSTILEPGLPDGALVSEAESTKLWRRALRDRSGRPVSAPAARPDSPGAKARLVAAPRAAELAGAVKRRAASAKARRDAVDNGAQQRFYRQFFDSRGLYQAVQEHPPVPVVSMRSSRAMKFFDALRQHGDDAVTIREAGAESSARSDFSDVSNGSSAQATQRSLGIYWGESSTGRVRPSSGSTASSGRMRAELPRPESATSLPAVQVAPKGVPADSEQDRLVYRTRGDVLGVARKLVEDEAAAARLRPKSVSRWREELRKQRERQAEAELRRMQRIDAMLSALDDGSDDSDRPGESSDLQDDGSGELSGDRAGAVIEAVS